MHFASQNGHAMVVESLINSHADINDLNMVITQQLYSASYHTYLYIYKQHNSTPIHLAAWKGHMAVLVLLINSGSDINARSKVCTYMTT